MHYVSTVTSMGDGKNWVALFYWTQLLIKISFRKQSVGINLCGYAQFH